MNHPVYQTPLIDLDDFEEMLADAPDDERWELISGRVVRMIVDARWEHNLIIGNLAAGLNNRFRVGNSTCRALTETFRLKEESSSSSLLPDLLVFCTRPRPGATFLSDATLVVEVLSKGTQRRDREEKWAVYQTLPSLRHYVLVERDRPHVETIDRLDQVWSGHRIADGMGASLVLAALDMTIPLAEIYADVFA